jgi:hypothetical protein
MLPFSPVTTPQAARGGQAAARRRLVLVALGLALALAVPGHLALAVKSPKPAPRSVPTGKYFIVTCSITHRNNDDAIVFPGKPGKSHSHTYAGNRSTDAFSTPESLRKNGEDSSCAPAADASAYWFPTLYARGKVVLPMVAIVYYARQGDPVQPFPPGLRMIAGNAKAKRPQSAAIVSWSCGAPVRRARTFAYAPNCSEGRGLYMNVNFPDCWDGRRLDSPDHARHMAYSARGRCPSSHRVVVPLMQMLIVYPAVRRATVASGRLSVHGDFMNGWEQDRLTELTQGLNH